MRGRMIQITFAIGFEWVREKCYLAI
jgi:hypothetical protein